MSAAAEQGLGIATSFSVEKWHMPGKRDPQFTKCYPGKVWRTLTEGLQCFHHLHLLQKKHFLHIVN